MALRQFNPVTASLRGTVSGDVRIISLESLLVRFLPQMVEEISARHPKITFTVLSVHPSEIGEALRSGDTDFGVVRAGLNYKFGTF